MNKTLLQKALPHFIAISIFLIVTIIFCKPALENNVVLKQADVSSWEAMSKQSFDYKEANGHFPMWTTTMFSGMPAYQIALDGYWSPLGYFDKIFQLWLPQPFNFFFVACICFYFMCICMRINPYAAIIGSLCFAFCTYSPIIITAGHNTKMMALAYTPALIGSVILIFDKKYLIGFALTALFTALEIGQGHQQISYYAFIIIGIMSLFYIGNAIKNKLTQGLAKSIGIAVFAGVIGLAVCAVSILPTYDYAKYSKRGGQLQMDAATNKNEKVVEGKTTGLSKEYAFQWSYGRAEMMSLIFPGVKGYGLYYANRDGENYLFPSLSEKSQVVSYITEAFPQAPAEQIAPQMSQSLYWGDQPFTNGPVYLGAGVCFLFIFGMFYLDGKHKWWLFTGTILGMLLSLGSNLDGFNTFLFNYLPLYNKFRVPTMALVIPQLLVPVVASLTLNKLMDNTDPTAWKKFVYGTIATGAIFLIGLYFYASSDFSNENKQRTTAFNELIQSKPANFQEKYNTINEQFKSQRDNQVYENWVMQLQQNPEATTVAKAIVSNLRKDRASVLFKDISKSLMYILIIAAIIALFIKRKLNMIVMIVTVTTIASLDLLMMGSNYLNEKSFDNKENYQASEFPMSGADKIILADKDPHYRVFNMSGGDPFQESKTSYYHKSIGGYHAAKMGIYDDLSANQLSGRPNTGVLNMLNAKWIITGEGEKAQAMQNPEALGNAWFIKAVTYVKGPVAEMKGLTGLNTKDSAVVDESFKAIVGNFSPADTSATIKMTKFDNDVIKYESNSNANNLALFSEIFYKDWIAYIDGKPVDIFKANYVLRGLNIPAGKHSIEFKFEPKIYLMSKLVSGIASWLLFAIIILSVFLIVKKNKSKNLYKNDNSI
jgi:Bacterial membrane protein YfhO